ncbi:MAG TPA: IS3 family transposase, partial [Clostridium sp.]|nr:IS3 family transposase [Clostridium sp.]
MPKSSYYYQLKQIKAPTKYAALRARILELFAETSKRYGYRRIHALLAKEGLCVSEKIV